jgi:hypothetical protein
VIEFAATVNTLQATHVFPIGTRTGVFVALFDRRDRRVQVICLRDTSVDPSQLESPSQPSPAPQYWSGATWVQGPSAGVGAASFVSTSRDPRVARMTTDMVVPRPWPLPFWMGAYLIGVPFNLTLTHPGRTFKVLDLNVLGVGGEGSGTVSGTPTELGAYDFVARATEVETGLYSTATLSIETIRLDWTPASRRSVRPRRRQCQRDHDAHEEL